MLSLSKALLSEVEGHERKRFFEVLIRSHWFVLGARGFRLRARFSSSIPNRPHDMKRFARVLILLLLVHSLTACVWLRLLQLKHQLEQFDENFATEVSDHFTLIFKHPVLLNDDFVTLAKLQPTNKAQMPTGSRWIQAFHKIDAQGTLQPGVDFFFTLDFDQDDYLTRWDFSAVFMAMVPAQFFEDSIRSLAKGRVDEASRKFKVDVKDRAKITVRPPTLQELTAVLGEPLETSEEDGKHVYLYRFLVDSPHIDKDYQDRRITDVRLYFDPKTQELTRMGGRFIGLKININLIKSD